MHFIYWLPVRSRSGIMTKIARFLICLTTNNICRNDQNRPCHVFIIFYKKWKCITLWNKTNNKHQSRTTSKKQSSEWFFSKGADNVVLMTVEKKRSCLRLGKVVKPSRPYRQCTRVGHSMASLLYQPPLYPLQQSIFFPWLQALSLSLLFDKT